MITVLYLVNPVDLLHLREVDLQGSQTLKVRVKQLNTS